MNSVTKIFCSLSVSITAFAYAATNVAGVNVIFNQFDQEDSSNCPATLQNLLVDKQITATFIISQDPAGNLGFGDLLLNPPTFNTSNIGYMPQIVLTNMGISRQFDLLGEGPTDNSGNNYILSIVTGSVPMYVRVVSTHDIKPTTGSTGVAYLYLSPLPAKSSPIMCALRGQVINSTLLPSSN